MKKNESKTDRLVRVILAIVFSLIAYYSPQETWQIIFYVVAGILTLTAIIGFCPLYTITCPANHHEKESTNPSDSKSVDQELKETPVSDTVNDELKNSEDLSSQNTDQDIKQVNADDAQNNISSEDTLSEQIKTTEASQSENSSSEEVSNQEKNLNQSEVSKNSETSNDKHSSDEEIKNS